MATSVSVLGEDVRVHQQPNGPAFDVVLLLHVGCVVVGLVTVVTSGATARSLSKVLHAGAPFPATVVRYFRPGVNWAGRSVYGIPVFGFLLLALSHGAYSLRDSWVMVGLAILVGVVVVSESMLWPAERRLQVSLASLSSGAVPEGDSVARDARVIALAAAVALALLVAGTAIMVAQP
jgi:hypothetical protein